MIQAVKNGASLTDQELQAEVDTIMLAVSWFSRQFVSRTSWDNIVKSNILLWITTDQKVLDTS
jgi:hypothetical protein